MIHKLTIFIFLSQRGVPFALSKTGAILSEALYIQSVLSIGQPPPEVRKGCNFSESFIGF